MAINNAVEIRREIIQRLSKLIIEDKVIEKIDRIPVEMRPRGAVKTRCCIHKERAVIRYKLMALLGYNIYDETDELTPISEYAIKSIERNETSDVMMTVVDEACSSCVKSSYMVTNLCRTCVARPCLYACKKDAITIGEHQAIIDPSKCINCGLCMQACPFHAIIYQPVPCEESCPVGAISKDENGIEHIDPDTCIYCGKCMVACPFGAIMEKTFMVDVFKHILKGGKVVALAAPSLGGQFKSDYRKVLTAIKQLGFDDVVEVAKGANITTENEREELLERLHEGAPFMTTSCCPSWMNLVYKHIPEMKPYVSTTLSPMVYTAKLVKEADPNAITVFLSPCVGKRSEAFRTEEVDYVVTYEELEALFKAAEIDLEKCEPTEFDPSIYGHGRGYAMVTGVVESVKKTLEDASIVNEIIIDGLNKANIRQLKQYAKKGECPGNFIEIMSCPGGCVNGCDTITNPKTSARTIMPQTK
ncbi:MAG: monomeric [FeFe] hydrogenase [Bacteroidales bacterium]|nr:monomeric [FeFe] hydrogenase [Bacteroidales bacterium]